MCHSNDVKGALTGRQPNSLFINIFLAFNLVSLISCDCE